MVPVSVGLLAVVLADPDPAGAARKAVAELQGTWELTLVEEKGGKPGPDEKPTVLTIKGDELTLRRGTAPARTYTLAVDPTKAPARLDLTPAGEAGACHAIYRLEKGQLTICAGSNLNPDDPGNRPQEFATAMGSKERPPKGKLMLTFKRAKN